RLAGVPAAERGPRRRPGEPHGGGRTFLCRDDARVIALPPPAPGRTPPRALTIAGSDSGGGAGIQADMRTMAMSGVHACVAVAAVTVQNAVGVTGVHTIPPEVVSAQIRTVTDDIGVGAAKTGMVA